MRDHRCDHELTRVKFNRLDEPCPVRDLCTKHVHRTLSFHKQPLFETIQKHKHEQHTGIDNASANGRALKARSPKVCLRSECGVHATGDRTKPIRNYPDRHGYEPYPRLELAQRKAAFQDARLLTLVSSPLKRKDFANTIINNIDPSGLQWIKRVVKVVKNAKE